MRDGRQAFFLFLPEGEDPDTIVKTEGADGFEQRINGAMTLSDYFFEELGKDIRLNTLEGKARLAEKVKPYLQKIPDGAFRDLMTDRLVSLTGVTGAAPTEAPKSSASGGISPKRSLVRAVITLLLQQPALGREVEPPFAFADLDLPGIGLMVALLETLHIRPDISTALLLEAFEQHADYPALQKLALADMPGDEAIWRQEFRDALAQLNRQARQQRLATLRQLMAQSGLSLQETEELRDLLKPN
jgi:DNA primase